MAVTWEDASAICTGLILQGRISKNAVRPEFFLSPFDGLIRQIQGGMDVGNREDLISAVGLYPIQYSLEAAQSLNGLGESDWVKILKTTATYYDAGIKLEKYGQRLQRGEPVDASKITYLTKLMERDSGADFTPLSEIKGNEIPYIKTGYPPIDTHLVGIPAVGLVVVGGSPGSGKTWFWITFSSHFAKQYPDKMVVLFSIEMMLEEVKSRYEVLDLPTEVQDRILICQHPMTVEEIVGKAAGVENLGLIGIDFADLLIRGETSEGSMSNIYRTLMLAAKELYCPIMLFAQLSNYSGGLPRPNNLRWTRLAEALGWSVWMTYNPVQDWFSEEEAQNTGLPLVENSAFLLAWKMRGGFRKHLDDSPGAILIPFRGDRGWGSKSKWFSLRKEI